MEWRPAVKYNAGRPTGDDPAHMYRGFRGLRIPRRPCPTPRKDAMFLPRWPALVALAARHVGLVL